MRRSLLVAAAVTWCLSATGCSTADDRFTGVVTTTAPRLCLGAPEASGECFVAAAEFVDGLRLDECVTVSFRARDSSQPGPRGTVTAVEPSTDC